VGDGHVQLACGESGAHRRVDVTGHQDQVGRVGEQVLLDAGEHAGGLFAVAAGADLEVRVRLAHPQPLDEAARESPIVMLSCVQDTDRGPLGAFQRRDHGRRLDEVRSRPHDREYGGSHSAAS